MHMASCSAVKRGESNWKVLTKNSDIVSRKRSPHKSPKNRRRFMWQTLFRTITFEPTWYGWYSLKFSSHIITQKYILKFARGGRLNWGKQEPLTLAHSGNKSSIASSSYDRRVRLFFLLIFIIIKMTWWFSLSSTNFQGKRLSPQWVG